jgi:PhnB protein
MEYLIPISPFYLLTLQNFKLKTRRTKIMAVRPIPDGYHSVTPYLIIKNAVRAIDFYKQAFGATEILRMADPDSGHIGHAEIKIGDSPVMLSDENPAIGFVGPQTLGGSTGSICLYVDDVDRLFGRAIKAGAKELRPVQDQFYGDRSGTLQDPFGHVWSIATHIEDVSNEELEKRFVEILKGQKN